MRFLTLLLVAVFHVAVYVIFVSFRLWSSLNWLSAILAMSAGVITFLLERPRRALPLAGSSADDGSQGALPGIYVPFASGLLVKSIADLYLALRSGEASDVLWSGLLTAISVFMLAVGSRHRAGT